MQYNSFGYEGDAHACPAEKDAVEELTSVAANYPQSVYTALQKSLQQEWQFVQRVVKDIDVEKAVSQSFLPSLFKDDFDEDDPRLRLAGLPVKHPVWHYQTLLHLRSLIMKQAPW
jgi:hypothetical protein